MLWGIVLFGLIVMLAIVFRSGWRPSWRHTPPTTPATPGTGSGHPTPPPHSTGAGWMEKAFEVLGLLLLVALIFGVGSWSFGVYKWATKPANNVRTRTYTPAAAAPTTEGLGDLRLMDVCYTPCSKYVDYHAKFRTDGEAIDIKFRGFDWIPFEPRGSFKAPAGAQSGNIGFRSKKPGVRVEIYKVLR